jgi:hypothetical protein
MCEPRLCNCASGAAVDHACLCGPQGAGKSAWVATALQDTHASDDITFLRCDMGEEVRLLWVRLPLMDQFITCNAGLGRRLR